jgi:hypothetical protein
MAVKETHDETAEASIVRKEYVRCGFCGRIYNAQRGHPCRS